MHTALCCMRAKLLQSCPTLCDSMDCSPPGSSVHGESPDRTTGVGCYAFLQGIFPTQIANLCLLSLLHWQTGSLLLVPPGKTTNSIAAAAKSLQSCLTVQPHRQQPARLPRPWDSPGKNTGVGCHFLFQ